MSGIELAAEVREDFHRILDHLARDRVKHPELRIREIIKALSVSEHSLLATHLPANGKRKLAIGRRSRGYVAWYRYFAEVDTVFVLAPRSQHQAGYTERGR